MKHIITTFFLLILLFQSQLTFAQDEGYKIAAIGFYNFENLFDTLDTPNVRDKEFTPKGYKAWTSEKYNEKLGNLAYVIDNMASDKINTGVSILGVSEIENVSVLEDLVAHPTIKDKDYGIVHHDSPDERGIDVALLYRKKHFKVTNTKDYFVDITIGVDTNYTRDVLLVSGLLDGEKMHFLVNHWPSRSGGEKRSEAGRGKAADVAKMVIDSLNQVEENPKVILMGDLNDNPTNKSLTMHLRANNKLNKVKGNEMYNPMADLFRAGHGSNAWRDTWSLFDQILVSGVLTEKKTEGFKFYKAEIYSEKFLKQSIGQFKGYPFRTFVGNAYQGGYSDHFPVYIYLTKKV